MHVSFELPVLNRSTSSRNLLPSRRAVCKSGTKPDAADSVQRRESPPPLRTVRHPDSESATKPSPPQFPPPLLSASSRRRRPADIGVSSLPSLFPNHLPQPPSPTTPQHDTPRYLPEQEERKQKTERKRENVQQYSNMSFGRPGALSESFKVTPPQRGSFPLDHDGEFSPQCNRQRGGHENGQRAISRIALHLLSPHTASTETPPTSPRAEL